MLDASSILTLLPPLTAIVVVIATRIVLSSLGAGILAYGLLFAAFDPLTTVVTLWGSDPLFEWLYRSPILPNPQHMLLQHG